MLRCELPHDVVRDGATRLGRLDRRAAFIRAVFISAVFIRAVLVSGEVVSAVLTTAALVIGRFLRPILRGRVLERGGRLLRAIGGRLLPLFLRLRLGARLARRLLDVVA
ncbi:MAG: hypothetical protein ACJ77E_08290, partial [Gaiellaceae bacterium]